MPVSHLNTSTTSLFASAVASLTDYTYSPLAQTPARYLATVLSGLTGGSYSHLTTPEHRLLALIATELSGTTVSQLTSSRAEMLAAIVNNPPEEGDTVLEEIDEAGNTEITEYINDDVTEVTGIVDFTDCIALVTFDTPNLATVGGDLFFVDCSVLETLECPELETVGGGLEVRNALITVPDFSALISVVGQISFQFCDNLQQASFPSLTTCAGLRFDTCGSLTALSAPSLLAVDGPVEAAGCALDETSVDAILVKLASLDGTGGTTTYDNQSVDLSGGTNAVPSAGGLTAKATLEGRGNTVAVNE